MKDIKTAKEMFRKLGYSYSFEEDVNEIWYQKTPRLDEIGTRYYHIGFNLKNKTIETSNNYWNGFNPWENKPLKITPKLQKAIEKQVEELGWK